MARLWPEEHDSEVADNAECRRKLCTGSRSFHAASLLLPRRISEPATALYSFCRDADDLIDGGGNTDAAISTLRHRLDLAYLGTPLPIAADRAFARTVARLNIPRTLPEALIEGFQWDASGRTYETLGDLQAYSARVAGTVGAMMTVIMGVRETGALARACDLGVAMQLTNIARDVGEDARAGRLYLPLTWMRDAGLEPGAWLRAPCISDALRSVVERLLDVAGTLYTRSEAGIAALPLDCRPGITAARVLYSEIGNEVRRLEYDSVTRRAGVPASRKLTVLAKSMAAAKNEGLLADPAALAETLFLVEAAAQTPSGTADARDFVLPAWWDVKGRAVRMIDLFSKLERRDRDRHIKISSKKTLSQV